MTDPKPTTNEQIALELGWRKEPVWNMHGPLKGGWVWVSPDKDVPVQIHPPDFEHDWEHAGPLLEELFEKCRTFKEFLRVMTEIFWCMADNECTLTEATALDWLAWKKEEA